MQGSNSDGVTLGLDDVHDLGDVLFASLMLGSFDHHANQRLGAGLTDQDTAGAAQGLGHGLDGRLDVCVVLCGLLSVTWTFSRTCG